MLKWKLGMQYIWLLLVVCLDITLSNECVNKQNSENGDVNLG